MSLRTASTFLAIMLVCTAANAMDNDDFIRFITDSGSVIEIENHQLENAAANAAVQPANANPGLAQEHRIVTRAAKQRFCGEMLVNALALVCKGNYKKRGGASGEVDYPGFQSGHYSDGQVDTYGWPDFFDVLKNANKNAYRIAGNGHQVGNELQTTVAAGGNAKLRPAKRGVVEECCKNPCSTLTLSQYCGN